MLDELLIEWDALAETLSDGLLEADPLLEDDPEAV